MPIDPTSLPAPSGQTILIVEDEFAVANDLRQILEKAGYRVSGIAFSVDKALEINRRERPDLVLLDIHLKGPRTGIGLAHLLTEDGIPFVYVSANNSKSILEEVKNTEPYGFVVKPFRERDVLAALENARDRIELRTREEQAHQIALSEALSADCDREGRLRKVARLFQPASRPAPTPWAAADNLPERLPIV